VAHRSAQARREKRALAASRDRWHHAGAVRIRDFLIAVYESTKKRLPKPLRRHQWRARFSLLQVYFETPAVHYEVWVQRKTARIEIGLHFEGDPDENFRWAATLAPRALEIQSRLGGSVELEEWTRSWTRLHETRAIDGKLDERLVEETAQRLCEFIEVLEPIVVEERAAFAG
jgi:hypothetical protein